MKSYEAAVAAAFGVALVAAPATAQQVGTASSFPAFDEVDANLDGVVSPAEFERGLPDVENPEPLFAEADTDRNGQVSRQEWSDWRERRVAGVAAPSEPQAAAEPRRENEIEVSLTDETLEGKYITDAGLVGLGGNTLGFGLLFSDDRDLVGSTELMAPGLLEQWLPPFISLSLGGKVYLGLLDDPDDDVFAIAPGAQARVDLPLDVPIGFVGRIFYAPDIVTFGDSDTVIEFDVRAEARFLEQTTAFVGYRVLNFEREAGGDDKIVNGIHAGLRFAF
jgi:hypothetical protein